MNNIKRVIKNWFYGLRLMTNTILIILNLIGKVKTPGH